MKYEIDLSSFDDTMSYDACLNCLLETIDNAPVTIAPQEDIHSTDDTNNSVNILNNWFYDHIYSQVHFRIIDIPNYFDGIKLCM